MLRRKKYRIIERNYTCRYGEVDLIAEDSGILVFIEVKTRMSGRYGPPELTVTPRKQRRYIRSALHYMQEKSTPDVQVRFDVVTVLMSEEGKILQRDIIRNAFEEE